MAKKASDTFSEGPDKASRSDGNLAEYSPGREKTFCRKNMYEK